MAKKTSTPRATAPGTPRSRAPRKTKSAKPAAAPLDIATVAGTETVEPTADEIAEAAYHRYLKRGGGDGAAFDDWLEAERELKSRKKR